MLSVIDRQLHLGFQTGFSLLFGLTFSLVGYERKKEKVLNQGLSPPI